MLQNLKDNILLFLCIMLQNTCTYTLRYTLKNYMFVRKQSEKNISKIFFKKQKRDLMTNGK